VIDTHDLSGGQTPVSDEAWVDVLRAVDKTYAELVSYQSELEVRNAELDEMRGFMASVFASVSDVLIVVDRDGLIEQAAGSFQMLLGLDPASVRGHPLADLTSDAALHEAVQKVVQNRKSVRFEAELPTSAGPTPIDLSITPRIGERGKSLGAVLIGRPVGELRQAYSELAESHRAHGLRRQSDCRYARGRTAAADLLTAAQEPLHHDGREGDH
jgi:two-component system sensor histidine kinase HupT/HoxJ